MVWGSDLWDRYPQLSTHTQSGIDFLEHTIGGLLRDRARAEADYARTLKSLAKRYAPKESAVRSEDTEYTHINAYKQMLTELVFQANQHELMAENAGKDQYRSVMASVKLFRGQKKRAAKEYDRITMDLSKAIRLASEAEEKAKKAKEEQDKLLANYTKAKSEGNKAEANKYQSLANKSGRQVEVTKTQHKELLSRAEKQQKLHFKELLPSLLEQMRQSEQQRVETVKVALIKCVRRELLELNPIVCKCLEAAAAALDHVDSVRDTDMVAQRLKSGQSPPKELVGKKSKVALAAAATPKKRDLERSLESAEKDLAKKKKELRSLRDMAEAYKANPKYGDSKQLGGEIERMAADVRGLEETTKALRERLGDAERRALEDVARQEEERIRHKEEKRSKRKSVVSVAEPVLASNDSHNNSHRSSNSSNRNSNSHIPVEVNDSNSAVPAAATRRSSSSISNLGSGSTKNYFSSRTISTSAIRQGNNSPMSVFVGETNGGTDAGASVDYGDDSWDEDEVEERFPVGVALYPYPSAGEDLEESQIPLMEGEEVSVVEGDMNGWTMVRKATGIEGYVPTAFIRIL